MSYFSRIERAKTYTEVSSILQEAVLKAPLATIKTRKSWYLAAARRRSELAAQARLDYFDPNARSSILYPPDTTRVVYAPPDPFKKELHDLADFIFKDSGIRMFVPYYLPKSQDV